MFIDDLDATAASEWDASIFTVSNRRAMVDSALRWSLHRLVRRLELRFKLLAMDVPSLLEVVPQVHTHGQRISENCRLTYPGCERRMIPWWQSVAPIEILEEGRNGGSSPVTMIFCLLRRRIFGIESSTR